MKIFSRHVYIIGNSPQVDWRRVFLGAIVTALAVSVYSLFFYHKVSSQSVDSEAPLTMNQSSAVTKNSTSSATTSNVVSGGDGKLELNQIIELYLQKQSHYQEMLNKLKNS